MPCQDPHTPVPPHARPPHPTSPRSEPVTAGGGWIFLSLLLLCPSLPTNVRPTSPLRLRGHAPPSASPRCASAGESYGRPCHMPPPHTRVGHRPSDRQLLVQLAMHPAGRTLLVAYTHHATAHHPPRVTPVLNTMPRIQHCTTARHSPPHDVRKCLLPLDNLLTHPSTTPHFDAQFSPLGKLPHTPHTPHTRRASPWAAAPLCQRGGGRVPYSGALHRQRPARYQPSTTAPVSAAARVDTS